MRVPWSLRGRLLAGAALWTVGLLGLAIVLWHVTLGNRHPPRVMRLVFEHATVVAAVCAGDVVLPDPETMRADIEREKRELRALYPERPRYELELEPVAYREQVAAVERDFARIPAGG